MHSVLVLTAMSYPIRPWSGTLVDTDAYARASTSRTSPVKVPSFRFLSSVSMIARYRASAASCWVYLAAMAFSPTTLRMRVSVSRRTTCKDNLGPVVAGSTTRVGNRHG
jgi:hypothetical protein